MPNNSANVDLFEHIKDKAINRVVVWWFDKRGERQMPALSDINPVEISSALKQVWLCDRLPNSERFRYRITGEAINEFWGCNLSGKHLDEVVPPERHASLAKKLRLTVQLPAIVYDRACLSLTEEVTKNGERIILPLSDNGRTVNALLGVTHRNWFRELEFDPYTTCSETTTVTRLLGAEQT